MPNIDHITRSIRDTTNFGILTLENESDKRIAVDPMCTLDHGETTQYPPAVAHVLVFFRSTVKATTGNLSLAQPSAKLLFVHEIKPTNYCESGNASKDLTRMRLRTRPCSIATVKVGTSDNVCDGLVDIDK
jgi:hypothetical protein